MSHKIINLTASMIRAYKSCPKLYEFQYVEMLKPERAPEYLTTGSNYHGHLEALFKGEPLPELTDIPSLMCRAFDRYLPWREWELEKIEEEFDIRVTPFFHMRGKIDAICSDGTPVEHKSAGQSISPDTEAGLKYVNKLAWDDQITYYLLALSLLRDEPVTKVRYTVCQKPSIRQKQNESPEEYLKRCEEWYDESKVRAIDVYRQEKELWETQEEVRRLASEIRRRKHFYRNPSQCSLMGCPYAAICLNYDPEITVGFTKKAKESEELSCNF